MKIFKIALKILFGLFFVAAGIGHFRDTDFFLNIMPPYLPWHLAIVYFSGGAEIGLGIALVIPKTSRLAAWGLIALLVAVFPANIYVFQNQDLLPASPMLHLLRLPMQGVMILWAWIYTRSRPRPHGFGEDKDRDGGPGF